MGGELEAVNFENYAMSTCDIKKQVAIIQDIMKEVMVDGEHYGIIPGTKSRAC